MGVGVFGEESWFGRGGGYESSTRAWALAAMAEGVSEVGGWLGFGG